MKAPVGRSLHGLRRGLTDNLPTLPPPSCWPTNTKSRAAFLAAHAAVGMQAVALFDSRRPDALFMDLRMPDLDGVGAIQRWLIDVP